MTVNHGNLPAAFEKARKVKPKEQLVNTGKSLQKATSGCSIDPLQALKGGEDLILNRIETGLSEFGENAAAVQEALNHYNEQIKNIHKQARVSRSGLWAFLYLIFFHIPLTSYIYSHLEDWTVSDSVWFMCYGVTTVGFGNMSPSTDEGKLLFIGSCGIGIPLVLVFLNWIGCLFTYSIGETLKLIRKKAFGLTAPAPQALTVAVHLVFVLVYILQTVTVYHTMEPWTWIESFYFVFVMGTTIGLGDYVPLLEDPYHKVPPISWYHVWHVLNSIVGLSILGMVFQVMQGSFTKKLEKVHSAAAEFPRRLATLTFSGSSTHLGSSTDLAAASRPSVTAKARFQRFFSLRGQCENEVDPLWLEFSQRISNSGEEEVAQVFEKMDIRGHGNLKVHDFIKSCREVLEISEDDFPDEKLKWGFDCLDGDKSGSIDLIELVMFLDAKQLLPTKRISRQISPLSNDAVNGNSQDELIRELKEENAKLKAMMQRIQSGEGEGQQVVAAENEILVVL